MRRLTKQQAQIVKDGLLAAATDKYRHPDMFPSRFGDIYISLSQKQAYLQRLANKGLISRAQLWRGWYSYCTYKRLELPF